jgi:hypothetical protein
MFPFNLQPGGRRPAMDALGGSGLNEAVDDPCHCKPYIHQLWSENAGGGWTVKHVYRGRDGRLMCVRVERIPPIRCNLESMTTEERRRRTEERRRRTEDIRRRIAAHERRIAANELSQRNEWRKYT